MTKSRNSVETVIKRISTTPMVEEYLYSLVRTGLYGKNPAEAAERLIAESIKSLIQEGFLVRKNEAEESKD